jgi:ABC-type Zn uptake system ZnuABC Zn-binding protein ZnuA
MRLLIPLIVLFCLAAACRQETEPPTPTPSPQPNVVVDHSQNPFKIVVSLPIFADMAREITGGQAQVTALIPAGVDPQTYQPTPDQAQVVSEAQMIFYNGLGMETPTEEFINAHLTLPALVIAFAGNVPSPSTTQPHDYKIYASERGDDPRLFLDPQLARVYPETIADSMVIKDGANAAYYNARYADYRHRLDEMDLYVSRRINLIPGVNRGLLVTHHNSLVHFARRYGMGVIGTVVEMGQGQLAQVIEEEHPPAVFAETGYDDTALRQIAEAAGIQVCQIDTDAVSDAAISYIKMMENNADEIASCLGAALPTPT